MKERGGLNPGTDRQSFEEEEEEEGGGSERVKDETGGERWLKEGRAWTERWRERGTRSDERSEGGREGKKRNFLLHILTST